jgi:hypothetical protein
MLRPRCSTFTHGQNQHYVPLSHDCKLLLVSLISNSHDCALDTYLLNAELNPICHLLALLGAHHILHVSRVRVKNKINKKKYI